MESKTQEFVDRTNKIYQIYFYYVYSIQDILDEENQYSTSK
jgi:hypothetical protein